MKYAVPGKDIWADAWKLWVYTVIPVNIGWDKHGRAIMGKGLAKQAAERFPEVLESWGDVCQAGRNATQVLQKRFTGPRGGANLVLFPTKPLHAPAPYLSWRFDASPRLIEKSVQELDAIFGEMGQVVGRDPIIQIPPVGCGAGHLKREQVIPILEKYLTKDRYVFFSGRLGG